MLARFRDRFEGGRVLAGMLSQYADHPNVVVLALPRGGVPVAFEVAALIKAPMDVFLVRKLGVPGHEELAMGALASGGIRVLQSELIRSLRISQDSINCIADREWAELSRREQEYRGRWKDRAQEKKQPEAEELISALLVNLSADVPVSESEASTSGLSLMDQMYAVDPDSTGNITPLPPDMIPWPDEEHQPEMPEALAAAAHTIDVEAYAARKLDSWLTSDDTDALVDNYANLRSSAQRKKVLEWAVSKARAGDLNPLLSIGTEDPEAAVKHHLNKLLDSLPIADLLPKVSSEELSNSERRSLAGILSRSKDPKAAELLRNLAEHKDVRVRESALLALIHFPNIKGLQVGLFAKHLGTGETKEIRYRCAEYLLRLGTAEALAAVSNAFKDQRLTPELSALLAQYQSKQFGAPAPEEPLKPLPESKPIERAPLFSGKTVLAVEAALILFGFGGTAYFWYRYYVTHHAAPQPMPGETHVFNRKPVHRSQPKPH